MEQETEEAIKALVRIAIELDGYLLEPIEMRKEAVRKPGSFMPHPEAMKFLTKIVSSREYSKELRMIAMQNLGR